MAQLLAMHWIFTLEDSNWKFFQVSYPVDTPTYREKLPGDSNWKIFQVGYPERMSALFCLYRFLHAYFNLLKLSPQ